MPYHCHRKPGGAKSTLARRLAENSGLPHVEVDGLLWREDWILTPLSLYKKQHTEVIRANKWIVDGLGRKDSIPDRFERATHVVLVDMPLWMHFWLAAERQLTWACKTLAHAPGGISQMRRTEALFQNIWEVDQTWMPDIRMLCSKAESIGKTVFRLVSFDDFNRFAVII